MEERYEFSIAVSYQSDTSVMRATISVFQLQLKFCDVCDDHYVAIKKPCCLNRVSKDLNAGFSPNIPQLTLEHTSGPDILVFPGRINRRGKRKLDQQRNYS
jgi:hypothetical protein